MSCVCFNYHNCNAYSTFTQTLTPCTFVQINIVTLSMKKQVLPLQVTRFKTTNAIYSIIFYKKYLDNLKIPEPLQILCNWLNLPNYILGVSELRSIECTPLVTDDYYIQP